MIDAVNVPVQTVQPNNPVLFAATRIFTGCTVRHEQGSGRFVITKPGIYKVTFNGVLTSAAASTALLSVMQDGEAIAGATIDQATTSDPETVSVSTLIRVYCCDSAISITNTGTTNPVDVSNANIIIERLA